MPLVTDNKFYGYGFRPLNSIEEPRNALGFTEGIFFDVSVKT